MHFFQSTISLQGSRIRSQTWPRCTSERGLPAAIHRHPYCLSHTRQGGCPQWSWGSDPGWDFTAWRAAPAPCPPPRREGGGGRGRPGAPFSAQNISCLSSGRPTMHVRTRLPARERRPRVTLTLASSVCESETKTSHTPGVYTPPALRTLMSLKHSFIMIFNLSGGFLPFSPFPPPHTHTLWSWI